MANPHQQFKVPVPSLNPLQESPGDQKDVREWLLAFDLYLDRIEDNQIQGQQLGDRQKNGLLCSHLGQEGLRAFARTADYGNRHATAHDAFRDQVTNFFRRTPNSFRARYDFNRRMQEGGESVTEFLTALRVMSADCTFGDEDDAIKHQLVSGSKDTKAQLDIFASQVNLDLNAVISKLRAAEAADQDLKGIAGTSRNRQEAVIQGVQRQQQKPQPRTNIVDRCQGCGSPNHRTKDPMCRALGNSCHKCNGPDHFGACCRNQANRGNHQTRGYNRGAARGQRGSGRGNKPQQWRSQTSTVQLEDFTLGCCGLKGQQAQLIKEFWVKTGNTDFIPVAFLVDTGADTTLISQETCRKLGRSIQYQPVNQKLTSVDGTPLKGYIGTFRSKIGFGGRIAEGDIHVVRGTKNNVLGNNFLGPLQVKIDCRARTVAAVQSTQEALLKEFPQLTKETMGTYHGSAHRIQLSPEAVPFAARVRPIPLGMRDAAQEEIREMDRQGIWKPVDHSDWAHPMVTVPKKTGAVRITTDLTKLNQFVIPDRFPLPRIKDILLNLSGSRVFSKLDLRKGYFHIPLHKESQHLTTTITPLGLRMYTRLPMGLKDSASAFQKRVQETLIGIQGVEVYIDDIVVHGRDIEEHDRRLRIVFARLQNRGFRLQQEKVVIGKEEIPAFGFIISAQGIRPDPANVKPIIEAAPPSSVKETQRFLGMVNYFTEFLPDVASLAEPLRLMTRTDQQFHWGATQELAFNTIKKTLVKLTELQIYDPGLESIITTDASDIGIGGMLSQRAPDGAEKPVAFFSKSLTTTERNYSATEKEALAAIRACEHWENLIWGQHFTLRTDHQALRQILSSPKDRRQSSKFQRWKERLEEFEFTVEYVPGPENAAADYLSRLQFRAEELESSEGSQTLRIAGIRLQHLRESTEADEELQEIRKAIESRQWRKLTLPDMDAQEGYYRNRNNLSTKEGIVFQGRKIVAPRDLRRPIIEAIHVGHPGMVRTKANLRSTYWWPGADAQVETFIKHCEPCQRSTKSARTPTPSGVNIPAATKAGEQWGLDITGPFYNGAYLVVLIDYFSRYPEVMQTKDITSRNIIRWIKETWDKSSNPSALVTDNGPQFVSQEFTDFLADRDIHHHTTSVYNPQENGLVESFNRFLKYGVQTFSKENWADQLGKLLRSYRTTPRDDKASPAEVYYGRKIRAEWQPNLTKPKRRVHTPRGSRSAHPGNARQRQFIHKGYAVFKRGDQVLTRLPWSPKGTSPWKGPLVIEQVLGTYTFRVSDGQVWNSRSLKHWRAAAVQPDEWLGDYGTDHTTLRRSTRITRGKTPQRFVTCVGCSQDSSPRHKKWSDHQVIGG